MTWESNSNGACASDVPVRDRSGAAAFAAETRLKRFEKAWGAQLTRTVHHEDCTICRFREEDFHYGRLLGQGSFSTVHRVTLRHETVKSLGQHDELCDHEYAMKRLKRCVLADPTRAEIAASDLILETSILMNLQHENIVQLCGVKEGDTLASLKQGNCFVLLELLVETLDVRLARWQKNQARRFFNLRPSQSCIAHKLENVALGIAKGMEYLHSKNLIFRDLKPTNIGFDESDQVKIFDFGLARDCTKGSTTGTKAVRRGSQPRLMTGGAGTPRYMAPEVSRMNGSSYGFPADVYSFSIVLWQIVANKVPYASWSSPKVFAEKVVKGKKRPNLNIIKSDTLKLLLNVSWSDDPEERPDFEMIRKLLENTIIPEYKNKNQDRISSKSPKKGFQRSRGGSLSSSPRILFGDESIGKSSFRTASTVILSRSDREPRSRHAAGGVSRHREISLPFPEDKDDSHGVSSAAERYRINVSRYLDEEVKSERKEFRRQTRASCIKANA